MDLQPPPWHKTRIGQPTRAEATYKNTAINMATGYDIKEDGYLLHLWVKGVKADYPLTPFPDEDAALRAGYSHAVEIIDSIS